MPESPELLYHTWQSAPPTRPQLFLTGWHRNDFGQRVSVRPNEHPRWVLDYSCTGCGKVRVGQETALWRERLAGVAHLYPPNTHYWEDTRENTAEMIHGYVVFTGGEAIGLDAMIPSGQCYLRIEDPAEQFAKPLEEIARAGYYQGAAGYWRALSAFYLLMELVLSAQHVRNETCLLKVKAQMKTSLSDKVRAYMQAHLDEPLTLQRLAQAMHASPSTLSHKFRQETGVAPIQALIDLRLNKAQALLQTGQKLEEIARQTGFCNAFYLSKMFKIHRGRSPRSHQE